MKFQENLTTIRQIPDPLGIMKRAVVDICQADNMVVIKTIPGNARPVTMILDSCPFDELVGTIGGSDTVFAITPSGDASMELRKKIMDLITH